MPPENLPPENFEGDFWVDRSGCSYIKTETGRWVPRMNLDRTRMCDSSLIPSAVNTAAGPTQVASDARQIRIDPETGAVIETLASKEIPQTYVQIGTYADQSGGMAVREKFASLGFPVFGAEQEPPAGSPVTVVLGPYQDSGFLEDALSTAKSLGHSDAYVFQNQ